MLTSPLALDIVFFLIINVFMALPNINFLKCLPMQRFLPIYIQKNVSNKHLMEVISYIIVKDNLSRIRIGIFKPRIRFLEKENPGKILKG